MKLLDMTHFEPGIEHFGGCLRRAYPEYSYLAREIAKHDRSGGSMDNTTLQRMAKRYDVKLRMNK